MVKELLRLNLLYYNEPDPNSVSNFCPSSSSQPRARRYAYSPLAGIETCPAKFVGRISLSAEKSGRQFIIGRYGYLPYITAFIYLG